MVARQEGQRKKLRGTPYGSDEKSKHVMCWCQFSVEVTEGKNLPTIECVKCKKRFHSICSGFTDDAAVKVKDYVCLMCTNTPSIPKLFLEPFRNRREFKNRSKSPIFAMR